VLVRLARLLLVFTLMLSLGLHWTVLQSVAWLGMTVSFSRTGSLTEALLKTFDGKHPCELCIFVRASKAAEKKHDTCQPVKESDYAIFSHRLTLLPPLPEPATWSTPPLSGELRESPPTPPPEFA
jgi:hypothetical protein